MKKTCRDCAHFRQHYVKLGGCYYSEIDYGHCTNPRRRKRGMNQPACEHYTQRQEA